jgi:hypothetical protein
MTGPDDNAMSTTSLMIGRVFGFQLIALDQRLSPPPLSHDTAQTAEAKESKTAKINTDTVLRINYLIKRAQSEIVSGPVWLKLVVFRREESGRPGRQATDTHRWAKDTHRYWELQTYWRRQDEEDNW